MKAAALQAHEACQKSVLFAESEEFLFVCSGSLEPGE